MLGGRFAKSAYGNGQQPGTTGFGLPGHAIFMAALPKSGTLLYLVVLRRRSKFRLLAILAREIIQLWVGNYIAKIN